MLFVLGRHRRCAAAAVFGFKFVAKGGGEDGRRTWRKSKIVNSFPFNETQYVSDVLGQAVCSLVNKHNILSCQY